MHSIHDNLSHVLNKSLDSVHHLHSEIETIHDQVKFIAAPIQWTSQALFVLLYGKITFRFFFFFFVGLTIV